MNNITESEFTKAIFAGATASEHRNPLNAFSMEQLNEISRTEQFAFWSNSTKDWVMQTLLSEIA